MSPPKFSLITDPWIPCKIYGQGVVDSSLREVFDGSRRVQSLACESIAESYALHRLLLVVLWRAHYLRDELRSESAKRFARWWREARADSRSQRPDSYILAYLDRFADRFELFGATPFMQVAGLETTSGKVGDVRRLLSDSESDYFGIRAGGALATLTYAEAARALVTIQAFDYSGIKSGALGDPRVSKGKGFPIGTGWTGMTGGVLIHGSTFRETLVLNTVASEVFGEANATDLPPWEREPDTAAERASPTPTGPGDLATWQSRRIRLFTDDDRVIGVIVSNGDRIHDAGANQFGDPMTAYRYSKNKSTSAKPVYYPRPHDTERTIWRALEPLLMRQGILPQGHTTETSTKTPRNILQLAHLREYGELDDSDLIDIELVSFSYGAQSSSVSSEVHVRLELPVELIAADEPAIVNAAIQASKVAQETASALGQFSGTLAQAAGGDYVFDAARTNQFLDSLEPQFRDWLQQVRSDDIAAQLFRWYDVTRHAADATANTLLRSAGPRALIGRTIMQNDRERIVSAGSAHILLLRKLKTILPRLVDETTTKEIDDVA